jgi:CubicO group peptidase (beta-lactamase class C family)
MFTAVAVAQLVEQGRLSFSDTIARLLPDYPNSGAARRITVAHLLTHTAGLPEYFASPRYPALHVSLRAPKDYWPLFAGDSLRFAPGSEWEYSNSNYIVLGSLIERVTGRDFREYIAARVFRPAGMDRTTYDEGLAARRTDVAVGYTRFGLGRKPDLVRSHEVPVRPGRLAGPAGGGLSTAPDLLRFADALLEHRLMSAAMTSRILEPRVATPDGRYTYGFEWQAWNGVRFVGHNGFADGAFDQVDMYPDLGYTVVVLSNTDMSGAGAIAYRLRLTLTARR